MGVDLMDNYGNEGV